MGKTKVQLYHEQKRCARCGVRDSRTDAGRWFCDTCAALKREREKKYDGRKMELYYERKRSGLCTCCGGELDNETLLCSSCKRRRAEANRKYVRRAKNGLI